MSGTPAGETNDQQKKKAFSLGELRHYARACRTLRTGPLRTGNGAAALPLELQLTRRAARRPRAEPRRPHPAGWHQPGLTWLLLFYYSLTPGRTA